MTGREQSDRQRPQNNLCKLNLHFYSSGFFSKGSATGASSAAGLVMTAFVCAHGQLSVKSKIEMDSHVMRRIETAKRTDGTKPRGIGGQRDGDESPGRDGLRRKGR